MVILVDLFLYISLLSMLRCKSFFCESALKVGIIRQEQTGLCKLRILEDEIEFHRIVYTLHHFFFYYELRGSSFL